MTRIALAPCTRRVGTTLMNGKKRGRTARSRTDLHGRISPVTNTDVVRASTSTLPDRPRVSSRTNDNYCVNNLQEHFCKILCCKSCTYCVRALTKERNKSRVSRLLSQRVQIKICERSFLCHKLLCQSPQEPLPAGGISRVYQPTIFGAQTQQQVETYIGSEQFKPIPQGPKIHNGDTRNHQDLPPTRGVGYLSRLQGCLLPYTNIGTVQEISEISCPGSDLQVQSTTIRSVHSTLGVHCDSKGGETDGHTQGYKNPPVPR